ncbi:fungal specific transcription factor domain-containing protein [Fonsecaea pedrosoi]|nr:fungal specific transcription factor domain-containing protein [Fonsecaea pedrosoi]
MCTSDDANGRISASRAKINVPRQFICDLESQLEKLQLEHDRLLADDSVHVRDAESLHSKTSHDGEGSPAEAAQRNRAVYPTLGTSSQHAPRERRIGSIQADLIDLGGDRGEAHYLGDSSGLHIARAVLETARQNDPNLDAFSVHESPPLANDTSCPTFNGPATLPGYETTQELTRIFFSHFQVQYPILVEEEFLQEVLSLSTSRQTGDPGASRVKPQFMLTMVIAISLSCLSRSNSHTAALAESYANNALLDLPVILQRKDTQVLQCTLLLLLYSLLTQTKTPTWYISGLCTRMCVDLGLHNEDSILSQDPDFQTDTKDRVIDTKRRLFWVTYSFDRTLSTILGRPFTLPEETIDVEYPCSTISIDKREQVVHWLRLQRIQSQMVLKLYGPTKTQHQGNEGDLHTWAGEISASLEDWLQTSRRLENGGLQDSDWWTYWYYNTLLFLNRPSPSRYEFDPSQLVTCLAACKNTIQLAFIRHNTKLTGFTWLDLQYQLSAGITLLFALRTCSDVRVEAKRDWTTIKSCLVQWESVLNEMIKTWPKVSRARDILVTLAQQTSEVIEREMRGIPQSRSRRAGSQPSQNLPSAAIDTWLTLNTSKYAAAQHRSESEWRALRADSNGMQCLPTLPEESSGETIRQQTSATNDETGRAFGTRSSFSGLSTSNTLFNANNLLESGHMQPEEYPWDWNNSLEIQDSFQGFETFEYFGNIGRLPYDDMATFGDFDPTEPFHMESALNFEGDFEMA